MGGTQVTDSIFEKLVVLPYLTTLKLDNTAITGKNIKVLAKLAYLKTINLTHTNFEKNQLNAFTEFKSLQKVFLYDSKLNQTGVKRVNGEQLLIDYGNYELPPIASDSVVY